jgi:hypothetical protein
MSVTTIRLDDGQLAELAERVAERVGDQLVTLATAQRQRDPGGLVDAKTVAESLGVARSWVYAKADELGAVRLGDRRCRGGARLRFDLAAVRAALIASRREDDAEPLRSTPVRRRQRVGSSSVGSVLKVRPR